MQFKFLLPTILSIGVAGCSPSVKSDAPQVSPDISSALQSAPPSSPDAAEVTPDAPTAVQSAPPSSPSESVAYELPNGTDLSVLQEGEINGVADSYLLVIGSQDKLERLALTALPAVESSATWPEQAAEWEEGFLQKMTRKILSEPAEFDSRQSLHIIAEAGDGDNSVRIDAYFFNVGKWNYTVALTAPSSTDNDNGNLEAVRDSIHVR